MNYEMNDLPEWLFEHLEQFTFAELNPNQQQEVETFFTQAEYNDLYQACQEIHTLAKLKPLKGKEQIKSELLEAFDAKHKRRVNVFWKSRISLQAAAALVLLFIAGTFLITRQAQPNSETVQVLRDTVRIEIPVNQLVKVSDTVIQERVVHVYADRKVKRHIPKLADSKQPEPTQLGLPISGAETLHNKVNQDKPTRIDEDSVVKRFGFVSL